MSGELVHIGPACGRILPDVDGGICGREPGHPGPCSDPGACPEWFDYQVSCRLLRGHEGRHRFEWEG